MVGTAESDLFERLPQVGDQIVGVLDADGIADERILDADFAGARRC